MNSESFIAALHPMRWDPIIVRSLLVACAVVTFGTGGYTYIEGWSPWESLFFTLVTLTTVGYGDYGLSDAGEKFTAILMVGGIGTVSFTVSQILQRLMSRAAQPELRMIEQAKKMQDHVIVCGLGRTGVRVIDRVRAENRCVVAIDMDEALVRNARYRGITALVGDATLDETLMNAGIERAASIAAVTSSDAVNAMICLSAHAIVPETLIIARAEDERSICKLQRAGATQVLSPSSYGGDGIAQQLLHPQIASLMPGLHGKEEGLSFAEFEVRTHGETIALLGARYPRIVFIAVRSSDGHTTMRPGGDFMLRLGDVIIIAGESGTIDPLVTTPKAA